MVMEDIVVENKYLPMVEAFWNMAIKQGITIRETKMNENIDLTKIQKDGTKGTKLIDLSNQRFGKWTVLYKFDNPNKRDKRTLWTYKCDCGTIRNIDGYTLRSGSSKSCGCSKDGHSKTRLYSIWIGIKDRTSCQDRPRAKDYIGRGITMCEEWKCWDVFKNWAISNGYKDTLSIDRIDNNKGYYPENCRWVDAKTQGQNKRNNIIVEINGETHILSEWCRILGVKRGTVKSRILQQGLTSYEALTIPFIKGNRKKLK